MGKASRDKGGRGEREVLKLLNDLGFPTDKPGGPEPLCYRCDQYRGGEEAGADVQAEGFGVKLAVESKLRKRVNIKQAVIQAERDAPEGYLPIARTREDRQSAIISMPEWAFVELMQLVKRKHGWKDKT